MVKMRPYGEAVLWMAGESEPAAQNGVMGFELNGRGYVVYYDGKWRTFPPLVFGSIEVVSSKLIIAASVHAAADVVSEHATTGTSWRFPDLARYPGGRFTITKVIAWTNRTALTAGLTVKLYRQPPTTVLNDNVANTAVSQADSTHYLGDVPLPALSSLGTGGSEAIATPSTSGNLPMRVDCAPDDAGIEGIVITRDAVTFTAGDRLTIKIFADRD